MLKVAFICVHNSCRSQIAEALAKQFASDLFAAYSAGTKLKSEINEDALRLMRELYGIDMQAEGQYPKTIDKIPPVDIVISMGCEVACPDIGQDYNADWNLEDPSGKSDAVFKKVIKEIETKVLNLKKNIAQKYFWFLYIFSIFKGYFVLLRN